ncbi:hypothetical protein [Yoonia sp. BS5-3]|uniref:Uncharacterized protein n=1 Tax=Yoonia phaeophyticola TaxID=3137369 RepID=A0ABZ2V430_9RHOB
MDGHEQTDNALNADRKPQVASRPTVSRPSKEGRNIRIAAILLCAVFWIAVLYYAFS